MPPEELTGDSAVDRRSQPGASGPPESHADGNATEFHHISPAPAIVPFSPPSHIYFTHGKDPLGNSQSFHPEGTVGETRGPVKMGRGNLVARGNEYVSEFMRDYASEDTSAPAPLVKDVIDSMTAEALEFQAFCARELDKLDAQVKSLTQENKELKKKLESKQPDDYIEDKHKSEAEFNFRPVVHLKHPPSRGKGSAADSSGNNTGSGAKTTSDKENIKGLGDTSLMGPLSPHEVHAERSPREGELSQPGLMRSPRQYTPSLTRPFSPTEKQSRSRRYPVGKGGDPSSESPSGLNPWTPHSVEDKHRETYRYKPGALLNAIHEINQLISALSADVAITRAKNFIAEARVGLPTEILNRTIQQLESWGVMDSLVYARAWYWKGRAHLETGEHQVALDSFQKALEKGLRPDCGHEDGKEVAAWMGEVKKQMSATRISRGYLEVEAR